MDHQHFWVMSSGLGTCLSSPLIIRVWFFLPIRMMLTISSTFKSASIVWLMVTMVLESSPWTMCLRLLSLSGTLKMRTLFLLSTLDWTLLVAWVIKALGLHVGGIILSLDKIWCRNPSKSVIGRCGGIKKSNAKKDIYI